MEKKEAIREWCVERSIELLKLGMVRHPDAGVDSVEVVGVAKVIEEYITSPTDN